MIQQAVWHLFEVYMHVQYYEVMIIFKSQIAKNQAVSFSYIFNLRHVLFMYSKIVPQGDTDKNDKSSI